MNQRETVSGVMHDLWAKNPEHKEIMSKAMQQLWRNADYRNEMSELLSRGLAERWTSAQWRSALMKSLRAFHNSPDERKKRSAIAAREYYLNGNRERMLAGRNTPERKARHGLAVRYASQGGFGATSLKQLCIDHLQKKKETTVDEWAAILAERYNKMSPPKSTPRRRARDMVKVVQRSTDLPICYDPVSERIWLDAKAAAKKRKKPRSAK